MTRIKFLNTEIDNLTMDEAIEKTDQLIRERIPSYVVTPNLDHICLIEKDPLFAEIYKNASLVLCDGKPLIWISKKLKTPIKEKISGSDYFPRVCKLAANKGYKLFILGAAEGVADRAAKNLQIKYPSLNVCGTFSPSYGFEKRTDEVEKIKEIILSARPEILAVSLGSPKGEKFIYSNYKELNVPLSMSIGASVDFEAGNVKRAPKWMSDHGFEWLFRITQDPGRLIKRYWNDAKEIIPIIRKYE